jgi:hypothetical protein
MYWELTGNCIWVSIVRTATLHLTLRGVCGSENVCTGIWWGNLRERDNWEYPGVDGRIILRWIFKNWDVGFVLNRVGS